MQLISELSHILNANLLIHKCRADCFAGMVIALIMTRTVNLMRLAVAFDSHAEIESRYRRLRRLLSSFAINFERLAVVLLRWFIMPGQKYYLALDRTDWYWGKQKINILMLSVCYEGVAIPLLWRVLSSKVKK